MWETDFWSSAKEVNVSRFPLFKIRRYGNPNEINVSQPPFSKLYIPFMKSEHTLYDQFLSIKKYNDVGIVLSFNHLKFVTNHSIGKQ